MSPKAGATLALVVRVSQVKGRRGKGKIERFQSPIDQVKEGTERAVRAGYAVQVFMADAEGAGVSGATPFDERPGMGEALRLVEDGTLAGIVVSAQDRLVRQTRDGSISLAQFQKRIQAAGAVLLIADNASAEVIDPNEELATGYAAAGSDVRSLADQWVREETAKRWMKAKRGALAGGRYLGAAPRGYVKQENGTLKIKSAKDAKTIREAFELRIKGAGPAQIARHLLSNGIACANESSALALLGNPCYRGALVLKVAGKPDQVNEKAHKAIVPPATWHAAQRQPKGQAVGHGNGGGALLAGLLYCETCGRRLTAGTTKGAGSGKIYQFYACRQLTCEKRASISSGKVEPVIVGDVMTAFEGYVAPVEKVDPELQADVDRAERELEAMSALSVADLGADLFRTMHAARRTAVEEARKVLSDALAATMSTPEERAFHKALEAEDPKAVSKLWNSYDVARRREIVKLHNPSGWTVSPGGHRYTPLAEIVRDRKSGRALLDPR